jgi:hypothetical protein
MKNVNGFGIFLDEEDRFFIADPFAEDVNFVPHYKSFQNKYDVIKQSGYDENGELTEQFFKIFQMKTFDDITKLGAFSYSAIAPFFNALRTEFNFFPTLFLVGKRGSGKSSILNLLFNPIMYGFPKNSIEYYYSKARLQRTLTEQTFPIPLDDYDTAYFSSEILEEVILGYPTLRRDATNNNDAYFLQGFCSFVISTNTLHDLPLNPAIASRSLILEFGDPINLKHYKEYSDYEDKIINGKYYGYYLLRKALELYEYNDLVQSINLQQKEIQERTYLQDSRSLLYAMIFHGAKIWEQVFLEHNLESELLNKLNRDPAVRDGFIEVSEEILKKYSFEGYNKI